MDDLPELPFEKVLSYLSLRDRLRSRGVSRRWYHKTNRLRVKTLCCSDRPSDFIRGKSRLVSGSFVRNFISTARFASFFSTFGHSTLSSLKHLRLCDLYPKHETVFAQVLQPLLQLEQLEVIRSGFLNDPDGEFELSLPMLTGLHLERVDGIGLLTLDAAKLQNVRLLECFDLRLEIVHTQSVERLVTDSMLYLEVRKLENLSDLNSLAKFDSTLMVRMRKYQTREPNNNLYLFENQPTSEGHFELKILNFILLVDGLDYLRRRPFERELFETVFFNWAELMCRPVDELPFYRSIRYTAIEHVDTNLAINIVELFTDLERLHVEERVQNVERFLVFLENFLENIVELEFTCNQPQDLFDRLPEHCAVQSLTIKCAPLELGFLCRLKNLMRLQLAFSVDGEFIRKILDELELLTWFGFQHNGRCVAIQIDQIDQIDRPKRFGVLIDGRVATVVGLDAVIQLIVESEQQIETKKASNKAKTKKAKKSRKKK